jgi:hypothetical protein
MLGLILAGCGGGVVGPTFSVAISGTVTELDGTAVAAATVSGTMGDGTTHTTTTDAAGYFALDPFSTQFGQTVSVVIHSAGHSPVTKAVSATSKKVSVVIPLPPLDPGPSPAVLQIVAFDAGATSPSAGLYDYLPTFQLQETSGNIPVRLTNIAFNQDPDHGPDSISLPGCARTSVVPAMGTWSTDEIISYCRDVIETTHPITVLYVSVAFTDDAGRAGAASAAFHLSPTAATSGRH